MVLQVPSIVRTRPQMKQANGSNQRRQAFFATSPAAFNSLLHRFVSWLAVVELFA